MLGNIALQRIQERAAYNGIDLSDYIIYPAEIQKEILYALEKDCTKRQVDKILEENGHSGFYDKIRQIIGKPDVEEYTRVLSEPLLQKKLPDMREEMKRWELILPATEGTHSWNSSRKGLCAESIQRHIDINSLDNLEPEITELFLDMIMMDCLIESKGKNKIDDCIRDAWERIDGEYDHKNTKETSLRFEQAEILAAYFAVCGLFPKEAIRYCGYAMKELKFSPREVYHLMLETGSIITSIQTGIMNGNKYFSDHKLSIRYEIFESGFLKKRLTAFPVPERPLVIAQILNHAKHGKDDFLQKVLDRNPDHAFVLLNQMFVEAVFCYRGLWEILEIPKNILQYISELFAYTERGRHVVSD